MAEPQAPLQGKISFQDVIDQNPEGWALEAPEFKTKLADQFFAKHVATQPGFDKELPEKQAEIRTQFNKQYGVGQVGLDDNVADDPLSKALIPIQRFGDLATLGIPARAWDAAKFGATNAGDQRDAKLKKYEADPGLYGDMYRLSQSGIVKGIGGMGGALKSTAGIVGNTAKSGIGSLLSTVGTNPALKPWLGTAQKAAYSAGATAYSGISNALSTLQGHQNPLQGLMSTALDVATIPIGGKTRLGNATVQAGAGGAQSMLNDVIHGLPVDAQRAIETALTQAGVGAAFPESSQQRAKGPQVRRLDSAQYVGVRAPGRPHNVATESAQLSGKVRQVVQANVDQAARHKSVTEGQTQKAKLAALKKQYENLSQLANDPATHPNVRKNAQAMQGRILEVHKQASSQYQKDFGKVPAAEKRNLDQGPDFTNVVALVKDMRAKGNVKQANRMLDAFTPDSKAKIFDEVHKQEIAEKKAAPKAAAKPAAPKAGTPVSDVLLDALQKASEKPVYKGQVSTEYRAPGPDEYKRMAKEAAGVKPKMAKVKAEKPIKSKADKPKTNAQQKKASREEITTTLKALAQHNEWAEQPARDFLDRYDIPYQKSKKGAVLHYRVFTNGWKVFKHNASVKQLLDQTGITPIAARMNKPGNVEAIKTELQGLAIDSDVMTGEKHKLYEQADQAGRDQYASMDAEENAYYERVEQNETEILDRLESVKTSDELADVFDALDSDQYQDMPPEFFDNMLEAYNQHVERIENGETGGSTKPQAGTGKNPQDAPGTEGAGGAESRKPGKITEKDLMPVDAMRQAAKEAVSAGEAVKIRYWAERTGETGEFQYKTLHDVKILPGKNGKETKWTGINADGQLHTYIERNNAGDLGDSNIISVEKTSLKSEFERVIHPETGQPTVRHIESGELIPQIAKQGVKSSTLHGKMDEIVKAVNENRGVPVDRILDTAREFAKQKELEAQLESMSPEARAKLYEREMGEPC